MIASSAWIGATGGFKHQGVSCVLAIALFGVTTLASGLLPASDFALFLAFTFAMGVSSPLYSSPQMALMQRKVDPDCLGRVFGLYGAVCSWAMPVGLIFSTLFADSIGVTRCFVLVGGHDLVLAALSGPSRASEPSISIKLWLLRKRRKDPATLYVTGSFPRYTIGIAQRGGRQSF